MLCRKCQKSEATGIVFDLCDPCFDDFEKKINQNIGQDGKYRLENKEFEYLADDFCNRSQN